jgi:hypothetical protein
VKLAGVRRQLEEARAKLAESGAHAGKGEFDPAYRTALRARNLIFHAKRGLAAAHGQPLPALPVTGGEPGALTDHVEVLSALDAALGVADDRDEIPPFLRALEPALERYLGWLKREVRSMLAVNK